MQRGDWRTTPIGYGDRLYLIQAVYFLVALVIVFIVAKTAWRGRV